MSINAPAGGMRAVPSDAVTVRRALEESGLVAVDARVLLGHAVPLLLDLTQGDASATIAVGTRFLDLVLQVLMVVVE